MEIAGITITHPARQVFPEAGLTKGEVAKYYFGIAGHLLPHLVDRPLSVLRCPQGRDENCFYQKHLGKGLPEAVQAITVREEDGDADYLAIDDTEGLIALIQFGTLEFHPWLARKDRLDRPDLMVFDLDPGEGVAWPDLIAAGRSLREILDDLGLTSFPKLTGGKGMHLVVPLERRCNFDTSKSAAKAIMDRLHHQDPDRFLVTASKEQREGKIFLDYLRNGRGATAVAPYSTRARPGAPVAVPLSWDELGPDLRPDHYSISSLSRRLASLQGDPWKGFSDTRQSLTRSILGKLGL